MSAYDPSHVWEATTRSVRVKVITTYLADQSQPPSRYVWAYRVQIENHGDQVVQLMSRRWVITDGQGRVEVVEGPGVVGEQPILKPGEVHAYVSGCPLPTASGSMVGSYRMAVEHGEPFDVAIPEFSLDLPDAARVVN